MTTSLHYKTLASKLFLSRDDKTLIGRLEFFRTACDTHLTNMQPAAAFGAAMARLYGDKPKTQLGDFACDILAICGCSVFIDAQKSRGSSQLITIVSVKKYKTGNETELTTQSHTLFIDKDGRLDTVNGVPYLTGHEKVDFLVPVRSNGAFGCDWIIVSPREMNMLLLQLKSMFLPVDNVTQHKLPPHREGAWANTVVDREKFEKVGKK